jgi:hypothetical protein
MESLSDLQTRHKFTDVEIGLVSIPQKRIQAVGRVMDELRNPAPNAASCVSESNFFEANLALTTRKLPSER